MDFHAAEDLALWLKCLAADLRFANLPEILHRYRLTGTQATRRRYTELAQMTNFAYALYGPTIWGKDAPEFEFGLPLGRRVLKKLRRLLGKKSHP